MRFRYFGDLRRTGISSSAIEYSHLAWINTERKKGGLGKMNIPILADKTKEIAKMYGIYIEEQGITLRGLFIIDPRGIVRQITINDLPVGRSVDETLRLLEAFRYTDEHGEVCPANWQKGDKAIKPDVSASKEYFASLTAETEITATSTTTTTSIP
ncbi:Putative Peroxiredoxin [Rhizopus microsporus]|nr:Putative Peroxiredoxin [Rhizopus microsporus]